ncbi:MAG TPA: hypothetical protein QGF95_02450 [Candidatus Latescibacteria bacterium]|nr:hypothetical protein [Gemmatimonadaceae bacterium]HJP29396.1 hypothetical protein [Candidatus Latescibacterota bacterium]
METPWQPEPELQVHLDEAVPRILVTQKPNGQFGTEPWISTDQNVLLPLAVAWSRPESSHHHSDVVLDAIVRGGLALEQAQDEAGMWVFRKKDHSEWGPIRMPWAYSRWMRAFAIVRQAMDPAARRQWEAGLQLGYTGIAAEDMARIHNIPAHHAMGLYCAGQVFERAGWCEQAADFMRQVADVQTDHGWWAEHDGPVVAYNFVYADALGAYYAMSRDPQVLPALEGAAAYHATFTYPDGSCVETIDGRNPYHEGIRLGNPGLTRSAKGRGWTAQQHRLHLEAGQRFEADYAAAMLLYAEPGPADTPPGRRVEHTERMGDQAMTRRRAPWFACLSAYTVPVPPNRWGQDRQSFVSLYHDEVGLILGGGNTKLQPLWSTFTVGDTELLAHTPGEEEPDFAPHSGLIHCPRSARLGDDDNTPRVCLTYGELEATVEVELADTVVVRYSVNGSGNSPGPVMAHVTLLPRMGEALRIGESSRSLDEAPIDEALGSPTRLSHIGWWLEAPAGARLRWPVLPHNPYRKDGHAETSEGRIVLSLLLDGGQTAEIRIGVSDR